MKAHTIVISALLGLLLGTGIGLAQTGDEAPTPVKHPVPMQTHRVVDDTPITLSEVLIVGAPPAPRATNRGPAKAKKQWVCGAWKELEQGSGAVKTCEWR